MKLNFDKISDLILFKFFPSAKNPCHGNTVTLDKF